MAPTLAVQGSTLGSLSEFIVLMVWSFFPASVNTLPGRPGRTQSAQQNQCRHSTPSCREHDFVWPSGYARFPRACEHDAGSYGLCCTQSTQWIFSPPVISILVLSLILRYVLLLYVQPPNFSQQTVVDASTSRVNFNVTQFEAAVGLDEPIGGNMFYVAPALNSSSSTGPNTISSTSSSTKTMAVPTNSSISGTSGHTSSASTLRSDFHFNFILVLAMCWLTSWSSYDPDIE